MTALTVPAPAPGERTRRPVVITVAAVVTVLHALVTSYGAYYFSFVFEDPDVTAFSYGFVALFWAVAGTGAVAAVQTARGSERSRRVLVGYCTAGILWTIAKLVFWSEEEALVFGVVALGVLLAACSRRVRGYTA